MRFTLIKDIKQDRAIRPILSGLLSFILLYLVADIFIKGVTLGLSYSQISLTLFGNMEEFLDPISRSSFLEFIHMEIFFIMMIMLTLSAVFMRIASKKKYSLLILNAGMITGLLSLITLGLSYFSSAAFINLYLLCFYIWHIAAFYMAGFALWRLYFD